MILEIILCIKSPPKFLLLSIELVATEGVAGGNVGAGVEDVL